MDSMTKNTVFLGFCNADYVNSSYRLNDDFHGFLDFFLFFATQFMLIYLMNLMSFFAVLSIFRSFSNAGVITSLSCILNDVFIGIL